MSIFSELRRRNVLRVGAAYLAASWLLIQIADTLIPLFALPDAAGRVLVIVLAIAFVPALLTAWLFELTPSGFKRESSVIHGSAESVGATRRFDRAIIAVLTLALVLFAVDRFVLDPARDARLVADAVEQARTAERTSADRPLIAVLAFDDIPPDGDLEYFSDGFSIELMELLSKIQNLRVIGRESAFWFKGKDASYAEIGEKLGVDRLLEGTVRVTGDQVRVTANLIDPSTGEQVWSYSPEARTVDDLFAIQRAIATEVVDKLRIELTGEIPVVDETRREVHYLYLQARHILEFGDFERFSQARDLLERVVSEDPEYFPGYHALGGAYFLLGVAGQLPRAEALRGLSTIMERAAAKWPDRVEIKTYRALMARQNGDIATAVRYTQLAIEQDPSAVDPVNVVNLFLELDRVDQAVEAGEAAVLINPVCPACYANLRTAYYYAGRFDEAIAVTEKANSFGLEFPADAQYAETLLLSGDAEAALAEYRRDDFPPPARLGGSAMAFHALGQPAEYEQALAELNELVETQPQWRTVSARVHAFVGDIDRAFEILIGLPLLRADLFSQPLFDSLREHPRYEELLEKAGIWPDDWRDKIEFDFKLPE